MDSKRNGTRSYGTRSSGTRYSGTRSSGTSSPGTSIWSISNSDDSEDVFDDPIQEVVDDPVQVVEDGPVQEVADNSVQEVTDNPDQENADDSNHENADDSDHENADDSDHENADDSDHENADNSNHENADDSNHENADNLANSEATKKIKKVKNPVPSFSGAEGTIPSQRGKEKKAHEGYSYTNDHKNAKGTLYWRCDERSTCLGRAIEYSNGVFKVSVSHNHSANYGKPEVLAFVHSAKLQATQNVPIRNILSGLGQLSEEAYPSAPSQNALRKACGAAKTKAKRCNNDIPFPSNINFEVPEEFRKLSFRGKEENFCFIDSGKDDPKRILGFTTPSLLKLLSKSDVIHSDGTFSTVPSNSFYQIYSLHGKLPGDVLMPMAFFLLPDKTAVTYTRTFRLLKEALPGLEISPKTFVIDFEAAAIKAIKAIFPFCFIILCFFHFSQSINRHIIQDGLAKSYRDEEENRILINKLKGLAMAHPDDVIDLFVELGSIEWGEFQSIYNYFEDTYIGRLTQVVQKYRPGQRKQAPKTIRGKGLFPVQLWNQHARTLEGQARTNNSVEGWNGAIATALGEKHPNMWRLLSQFQTEALKTLSTAEDISIGCYKKHTNKMYVRNNQAVMSMVSNYEDCDDKMEFLNKIGRHISTFASGGILQKAD